MSAAEVVAELTARLSDPARTAALASEDGSWHPLSLTDGHPGVALLFAELGHDDPAAHAVAHAHLRAASAELVGSDADGLYQGLPAVAFAARAARTSPEEYERLLAGLDRHVLARAAALADVLRRADGLDMRTYDLIGGLTGLVAYLLAAGRHDVLPDLLGALIGLAEPAGAGGRARPGWWVRHTPLPGPSGFAPPGHFNLGMAHGVPGLLAQFAIAARDGIRVPGQERAIRTLAEWLLSQRITRDGVTWWPATRSDDSADDHPRVAWCYGTPGVASALQQAGIVLGEPSWIEIAAHSLATSLERALSPDAGSAPIDHALCHGWSGLLHLTWRMHHDVPDPRLAALIPQLAQRVLDGFRPDAPFGYRYTARVPVTPDRPGFLEGAAGIALALHCYVTDSPPVSGWDRALLVA